MIGGLSIPDAIWHGVAREFALLKARYSVTQELKWKHFGQKDADRENCVGHLSNGDRDRFRTEVFDLIIARKALRIIACVTSCEAAYGMPSVNTTDDIYHLTYKGVTERFQYLLQDMTKEVGAHQYGMVIADHRMHVDDTKLRAHHHGLIDRTSTVMSKYNNLIETIQFAPSHFSLGLQLVDMVSGAIGRYFQHGDKRFVLKLLPAFRRSPSGDIAGYGLVEMPKGAFIEPSGGETEASPARSLTRSRLLLLYHTSAFEATVS